MKMLGLLAAFAMLVAWYALDGRYSYFSQPHDVFLRVDRLTGKTAYCLALHGCMPLEVNLEKPKQ